MSSHFFLISHLPLYQGTTITGPVIYILKIGAYLNLARSGLGTWTAMPMTLSCNLSYVLVTVSLNKDGILQGIGHGGLFLSGAFICASMDDKTA